MPLGKRPRPDAMEFAEKMMEKYPTVMSRLAEEERREMVIEEGGEGADVQTTGDALGRPKS